MILVWVLVILLACIVAAGVALSFYMTRRSTLQEVHTPAEYGLEYEEVTFKTDDGMELRGWFIPAPSSRRAVIVMHGHTGSMDWDVFRAAYLQPAGFNVLLFDFRAHGRSPGEVASFGYLERCDVLAAVRYLKERGMQRIGTLGFSYGGMAAMLAAAACSDITAVISDGGPATKTAAFSGRGVELGLPRQLAYPFAWLTVGITSLRLGANLFGWDPLLWVGKIAPRPIFFIHGERDQYLPDFDRLYAAAGEPKEIWRVADAGHTTLSQQQPEEHQRRVVEFFQKTL